MYKYHHPIVSPLVHPSDELVIAFTESDSSTCIEDQLRFPKFSSYFYWWPCTFPDNGTELEKLVESSDADLDEVVKFGSCV